MPNVLDDQLDEVVIIVSGMPVFIELGNRSLSIKPKASEIGMYPLTIILRDLNKFSMVSSYYIDIEITD